MDRIYLKNLVFRAHHGALPEETALGQRFEVDLVLEADLQAAGKTDDLILTVNYAAVYRRVAEIVTGAPCKLIECLAETIASAILTDFPRVEQITVTVRKPFVPLPGPLDYVAAELTRQRP